MSLKSPQTYYQQNNLLVEELYLQNYVDVLSDKVFITSLLTTFILILISILISIIVCSLIAYVLELFDFKFKKLFNYIVILISLIPVIVIQVFTFQVLHKMMLYDTIIGVVLLYSVSDIVIVYVFRDYIRKIPEAVTKSAVLFGASYFKIYTRIVLPQLRGAIMFVVLFKSIIIYNDFYIQFLYLPTKRTLSTYMFTYIGDYQISWPHIAATIVLSFIPILCIVVVGNKLLRNIIAN